jgi:hypothetical protein
VFSSNQLPRGRQSHPAHRHTRIERRCFGRAVPKSAPALSLGRRDFQAPPPPHLACATARLCHIEGLQVTAVLFFARQTPTPRPRPPARQANHPTKLRPTYRPLRGSSFPRRPCRSPTGQSAQLLNRWSTANDPARVLQGSRPDSCRRRRKAAEQFGAVHRVGCSLSQRYARGKNHGPFVAGCTVVLAISTH